LISFGLKQLCGIGALDCTAMWRGSIVEHALDGAEPEIEPGTTIMFSTVELSRSHKITTAIGA
jgi:hypothetical protein